MRRAWRATPRSLPSRREKNVTRRSLSARGSVPITSAGERPRATSRREEEAELAQGAGVLPPGPPHLHAEREVHLDPEEALQLDAGRRPDPLEHLSAPTHENPPLGILL